MYHSNNHHKFKHHLADKGKFIESRKIFRIKFKKHNLGQRDIFQHRWIFTPNCLDQENIRKALILIIIFHKGQYESLGHEKID